MSTPDLRIRVRRRVDPGCDPVAIFQELSVVPSPTFLEYVIYGYLAEHFRKLRSELPAAHQDKFTIGYSSAGQMHVAWRGLPADTRRTVLVAHVDREGLLVREIDWKRGRATCWHTAGRSPEPFLKGGTVILRVAGKEVTGTIAGIYEIKGVQGASQPFDHLVEIQELHVRGSVTDRMVPNDYFVGFGNYDVLGWDVTDGVIAATNVDNTAGVSVLVTLMSAIARNAWSVNVDCLFTTCEESGFCGIVDEILEGSTLGGSGHDDVVCLVVDSSSHHGFLPEKGFWVNSVVARPEEPEQRVEISLQDPVVRTGDATGTFDRSVARLLLAAATNLEGAGAPVDWIQPRSAISISGKLRGQMDGPQAVSSIKRSARQVALVGRMTGGWCEATPLVLANALRAARSKPPSLKLRVGSVAIPMGNYRNTFNCQLQPERCHGDALRGACQRLGEAVRLCHRWPFQVTDERPGVHPKAEQLVAKLLSWQDQYSRLSSITRGWVRSNGAVGGPA